MGEIGIGKLRMMGVQEIDTARGLADDLMTELLSLAGALRAAREALVRGESMGGIGTPVASDLDMASSRLARRVERFGLLMTLGHEAEGGQ